MHPIRHLGLLTDLNSEDIAYFAGTLMVSTTALNDLFGSMPYIMFFTRLQLREAMNTIIYM